MALSLVPSSLSAGLLIGRRASRPLVAQAEISERLLDRLEDCKRDFPNVAVIGGAGESVLSRLTNGRAGITEVHYLDHSPAMLDRARAMQQVTGASLDVLPRLAEYLKTPVSQTQSA